MDRFDERKPDSATMDETDEQPRQGDVLGLSGLEVPKAPDPSTEYDAESAATRSRAGDVLGLAHEHEDETRGPEE